MLSDKSLSRLIHHRDERQTSMLQKSGKQKVGKCHYVEIVSEKLTFSRKKIPFIHLSSFQPHLLKTGATNKREVILLMGSSFP